jgi:hypothetical protein
MEIIILSYLIYNVLIGIYFAINYYQTEGGLTDNKEFWWLLLFPAMGLGKWRFQQKNRAGEETEFPEKWFMYKYMIKVNWCYIITIGAICFIGVFAFGGLFGSGMDWANHQDNQVAAGFGILADIGILFLFILFFLLHYLASGSYSLFSFLFLNTV